MQFVVHILTNKMHNEGQCDIGDPHRDTVEGREGAWRKQHKPVQQERNMYRQSVKVPCREACPAGIDVPRYLRFIVAGKYAEALAVIR